MSYFLDNTSPPLFVTDMVLLRSNMFTNTIISSGVLIIYVLMYVCAPVALCCAVQKHHRSGVGAGKTDRDKLPCNDTYSIALSKPPPPGSSE